MLLTFLKLEMEQKNYVPQRNSYSFWQLSPVLSTFSDNGKIVVSGRKVGYRQFCECDWFLVDLKPIVSLMPGCYST